jgi:hypothetical protein
VRDNEAAFINAAKQQALPKLAASGGEVVISYANSAEHVAQEAFRLNDGEVSHILEVTEPEGWLIVRRQELVPADANVKFENVRAKLEKSIADKKKETEIRNLFLELRKHSVVRDYLNKEYHLTDVMVESAKESERKLQEGATKPTPRGPASASGKQ